MFVKKKRPAAFWPCPVSFAIGADVVEGDGVTQLGTTEEVTLLLKFRRCGNEEYYRRWRSTAPINSREELLAFNRALFTDYVEDWADYVDEAGQPIPFTDAEIDELLDQPTFVTALGTAYTRFHLAQPEERLKNSAPSPAGGPATAAETMEASATS